MDLDFRARGEWLARHILPCEPLIRARLGRIHVYGVDVDDIIQETYARLLSVPSLEDIRYPKEYAVQTAMGIVIDQVRRSRVVSISSSGTLEQIGVLSLEPNAEERLEFREELEKIGEALATLPKMCRETLILRRIEGLSQRETAHKLGISEKTVEKHMTRGMWKLMDVFGRGGKTKSRSSTIRRQGGSKDGIGSSRD